jgi:hypothetical protein
MLLNKQRMLFDKTSVQQPHLPELKLCGVLQYQKKNKQNEDLSVLGCNNVSLGEYFLTFQMIIAPPLQRQAVDEE